MEIYYLNKAWFSKLVFMNTCLFTKTSNSICLTQGILAGTDLKLPTLFASISILKIRIKICPSLVFCHPSHSLWFMKNYRRYSQSVYVILVPWGIVYVGWSLEFHSHGLILFNWCMTTLSFNFFFMLNNILFPVWRSFFLLE